MGTEKQPLVSIVTPAYNEEKVISECIESVLAQSYPNWDYLIVNNCSDDNTLAIAERYAEKHSQIRVVSNEVTVPPVANFNRTLRHISPESKYCKIVLADDWIFPGCLEQMVALAEANPSIGIVGAYGLQEDFVLWQGLHFRKSVFSGREVCRDRLQGGPYVFGSQTSVMFRSDLVRKHDPFYNESNPHGADSEACFQLLKGSDFGFVYQILTFSRLRDGSLRETSRELNAAAADALHEMVKYGPYFLTAEEYAGALQTLTDKYYDFLAASAMQGRDAQFWEFHKSRLKGEGLRLSYAQLAFALGRKILGRFRVRQRNRHDWGL
jgi:glycosyltransferase involved in cell wall biosynthesis